MKTKIFFLLGVFSSLFLSSCQVSSKTALFGDGGRTAYNEVIHATNEQELLLNIVRSRYLDSSFFLNVSNVTTQFTYNSSSSASLPIPGFTKDNPFVLGGTVFWQNQPTLQFMPLEGQKFAQQLARPIDLQLLQDLIYADVDVDRIFRLLVQNYGSLINCSLGAAPSLHAARNIEAFYEATELLRYFQAQGELKVGIKEEKSSSSEKDVVKVLQIAFPKKGAESEKLVKLAGNVREYDDLYVIDVVHGFQSKGKIGVMTRCISTCINYLSQGVEVPQEDLQEGRTYALPYGEEDYFAWEEMISSLLKVKYSYVKPQFAFVAVKYRNKWFYIDDRDQRSKKTFALLLHLYHWQSGIDKTPPPILSLPLG